MQTIKMLFHNDETNTLLDALWLVESIYPWKLCGFETNPTPTAENCFCEYVRANRTELQHEFLRKYSTFYYYDSISEEDDTIAETITHFKNDMLSIAKANIHSWARMWLALTSYYNPLWNVDGTEKRTLEYGEITNKNGEQRGISKNWETSIDSTFEKETAQAESVVEEITNKVLTHTDTDTFERGGNIGVTKSTELVESELLMRQKAFISYIFDKIYDELLIA